MNRRSGGSADYPGSDAVAARDLRLRTSILLVERNASFRHWTLRTVLTVMMSDGRIVHEETATDPLRDTERVVALAGASRAAARAASG